jgi:serine/threonine protein kinase
MMYSFLLGIAETESGIFRQILQGKLDFKSDPWPTISEAAKDLIYKMLERSPKKRISAHEALCMFILCCSFGISNCCELFLW